jgi:hypothetical protein
MRKGCRRSTKSQFHLENCRLSLKNAKSPINHNDLSAFETQKQSSYLLRDHTVDVGSINFKENITNLTSPSRRIRFSRNILKTRTSNTCTCPERSALPPFINDLTNRAPLPSSTKVIPTPQSFSPKLQRSQRRKD